VKEKEENGGISAWGCAGVAATLIPVMAKGDGGHFACRGAQTGCRTGV